MLRVLNSPTSLILVRAVSTEQLGVDQTAQLLWAVHALVLLILLQAVQALYCWFSTGHVAEIRDLG